MSYAFVVLTVLLIIFFAMFIFSVCVFTQCHEINKFRIVNHREQTNEEIRRLKEDIEYLRTNYQRKMK